MSKALDRAADAARNLSEEEQDKLAAAMMEHVRAALPRQAGGVREARAEFAHAPADITPAFSHAIEAAASLSESEQDGIAGEIMDAVGQARFRKRMAWRERMLKEGGPLDGRSEEFLRHVREFREGFVFRHERDGA